MKTSSEGIYLMHKYEACSLKAYPDPATGGAPWTVGFGETGPHVCKGLVITQAQADKMFTDRLRDEFEPGVKKALDGHHVTQREFDALVCFAYNVGVASLRQSTLMRMIQDGNKKGAAEQFLRWDKAAGKRMLGLYRRRYSERLLFLGSSAAVAYVQAQAIKRLP